MHAIQRRQVSRTRNMADDRDDKGFQILLFRIAIHNQQNGQKTKKYETTNNNQQRNIVNKTKRTSNQQRRRLSITWLQLSRTQ